MVCSKFLVTAGLIVLLAVFFVKNVNNVKPKHPDVGLNIEQIILKYGYPLETHQVTTVDEYILTLHRIPHGKVKTNQKRIPILFMHGFIQSAVDFVNLGPDKALSLLLADKGYDIWLGNARGTTWSRKHKTLDPDSSDFWDFSLHEIGLYDVRAFIDYIFEVTGESNLHYVGYSQGTSVFFILMSEMPEYANKIRLMSALAPAIFLKNPQGPLTQFLINVNIRMIIKNAHYVFNLGHFFSETNLLSTYLKFICDENSVFVNLCIYYIFTIQGYNPQELNKTMLSLMFSNAPAGASPKQIIHIIQMMELDDFQQVDLGTKDNLIHYGQSTPPTYNLSRATTPVALYYSQNDRIINPKNIDKIVETLPNVVKRYLVPMETFNHNDFVYAINVVNLLYNSVIEEILKY